MLSICSIYLERKIELYVNVRYVQYPMRIIGEIDYNYLVYHTFWLVKLDRFQDLLDCAYVTILMIFIIVV